MAFPNDPRVSHASGDTDLSRKSSGKGKRTSYNTTEYTNAIRAHAECELNRTLYPARVYEDLANFLDPPAVSTRRRRESIQPNTTHAHHAILYNYSKSAVRERQDFKDAQACADAIETDENSRASQILFLRGHSTPPWLKNVGAKCRTDPEFLNSNMMFNCRESYFSYPSLPSSYPDIIRLRISTIGMREHASGRQPNSVAVETLRIKSEEKMKQYLHELSADREVSLSDSIVRDYHVLDEQFFVVEQEVAVCLHKFGKGWLAWICQDAGNSLAEGVEGPWLSKAECNSPGLGTTFYPIIQHGRLNWFRKNNHVIPDNEQTQAYSRYPQTAALLPLGYGQTLDKRIMACDPLYALAEVFRLCASSENQFLRLLETTISYDTDYKSLQGKCPTLSNLLYCRSILSVHSERLKETIKWIKRYMSRNDLRTSIEDDHLRTEANAVINDLLTDFEHLVHKADSLSGRFDTGMAVIGNNAMLNESRKAIVQARRVERLTFFASIFVPLSFTTSLFGMNVSQLGTGNTSIAVWVAVSLAVMLVTTLTFIIDGDTISSAVDRVMQLIARMLHGRKRKTYNTSGGFEV